MHNYIFQSRTLRFVYCDGVARRESIDIEIVPRSTSNGDITYVRELDNKAFLIFFIDANILAPVSIFQMVVDVVEKYHFASRFHG